jgi:pyruvate/2-oxoglutarate dehydrogenase complex dihydrolipoamide acyltransferase (E2) component
MTVALACDHRAVDGAYAAGFLDDVRKLMESPRVLGEPAT